MTEQAFTRPAPTDKHCRPLKLAGYVPKAFQVAPRRSLNGEGNSHELRIIRINHGHKQHSAIKGSES